MVWEVHRIVKGLRVPLLKIRVEDTPLTCKGLVISRIYRARGRLLLMIEVPL